MNPEISLYFDDLRDCPKGFVAARSMEEAVYFLSRYSVSVLSLDHDMGSKPDGTLHPDGSELVRYMGEHGLGSRSIYIHTDNPVGREAMHASLLSFKRRGFMNESTAVFRYGLTPNIYGYYTDDFDRRMKRLMVMLADRGVHPFTARFHEHVLLDPAILDADFVEAVAKGE